MTITACSRWRRPILVLALMLCTFLAVFVLVRMVADDRQRVAVGSCRDILDLYRDIGYDIDGWAETDSGLPRVVLVRSPALWCPVTGDDVRFRKSLFLMSVAPLILIANEAVLAERERLAGLDPGIVLERPAHRDARWLADLALHYGVIEEAGESIEADHVAELLERVDAVPLSLALAQAAEESGWGTSRYAVEGNALFGQYTWDDSGLVPRGTEPGRHEFTVRAFENLLASVRSYLHNLNTHPEYAGLRDLRRRLREGNGAVPGRVLAATLTGYAERGEAYVSSLRTIIDANRLGRLDTARLQDGETFVLEPADRP